VSKITGGKNSGREKTRDSIIQCKNVTTRAGPVLALEA